MAIGSGLAASLGISAETTPGTYVAPARFLQVNNASVQKVKNTVQGGGLAAGRMVQAGNRRIVATEAGTATWEQEVTSKNMGLLLQNLMGTTVTPVQQGATTAYLQTHLLADNIGKSLTVQLGIPDTGGTVRPYTGLGGKVLSAEFSCAMNELLTVTPQLDLKRVIESESLAAPSYTTGTLPFHFGNMTVKLGTYGSTASVTGVKGVNVTIERPQNTERFYAGAAVAGTKAEPIMNDWVQISGSLDVDFVTKGDFADRFAADTSTAMDLEWVMPTAISGSYYPSFKIRLSQVFFDEGTPVVEGPDIVSTSFAFVAQYDETNPIASIEYQSTDTSV